MPDPDVRANTPATVIPGEAPLTGPPALVLAKTLTPVTVVNSVAETTMASYSIAAAAPGDIYRLTAWGDALNNTGLTVNWTWRLRLGATPVLDSGLAGLSTGASRFRWRVIVDLCVVSLTSQIAGGQIIFGPASGSSWNASSGDRVGAGVGAATENLATPKTLAFSIQLATADALAEAVGRGWYLEKL